MVGEKKKESKENPFWLVNSHSRGISSENRTTEYYKNKFTGYEVWRKDWIKLWVYFVQKKQMSLIAKFI